MKLLLFLPILFLIACGSSKDSGVSDGSGTKTCEPGNNLVGTYEWSTVRSESLTIYDNCTGFESNCGMNLTYSDVTNTTVTLNVLTRYDNNACLPIGTYSCVYYQDPSTNDISIDCGYGSMVYFRI